MLKSMQLTLSVGALSVVTACGGMAPSSDIMGTHPGALSLDDGAACARITRMRLAHLSGLVDAVLALVQAEIADPRASTDPVDAIYYNNVKLGLDDYRANKAFGFSDDAPGAVPTPATVEALPYQVGIMQQDLATARYRTFVRVPRTSRVRRIGDQASVIAQGLEAVAQDAYDCHEGITGNNR